MGRSSHAIGKHQIFNGKGVVFCCTFAGKKAGEKPMKKDLEKLTEERL